MPEEILAEAARRTGMKRSEIVAVTDTDAGRIIDTADGNAVIDVPADRPDGAGQTGLLIYRGAVCMSTGLPRYVDLVTARHQQGTGEAWTVADLDVEAARVHVPAPEGGPSGPSRRAWIGTDPIRARGVAHDRHGSRRRAPAGRPPQPRGRPLPEGHRGVRVAVGSRGGLAVTTVTNPHAEMARAVLAATEAATTALHAITTALATGGELGVPTFGFAELMAARGPLGVLINEHGPAVALARNELVSLGVTKENTP